MANNNNNSTLLPRSFNNANNTGEKKDQSYWQINIKRWIIRFQLMPRFYQILLGLFVWLGAWMVFVYVLPLSDNAISTDVLNKPRILELQDQRNTNYTATRIISKIPEHSDQRRIIDKYNPLPRINNKLLRQPDSLNKGDCKQMHDWQTSHNPTCNLIHEATSGWDNMLGHPKLQDFNNNKEEQEEEDQEEYWDSKEQARLVAGGAFRNVWKILDYDGKTKRALKTLRVDGNNRNFDLRAFDRHRRDAVSFDQLTASPLIVDMYGYCTNSALFDWGDGGDLKSIFEREPDITKDKLLHIAYNVSLSISHAHNLDEKGRATLAHTDIKPDQFLFQDGYYKLTDFNRVRFLTWNESIDKQCGFKVGKNGGIWRSPEEYNYNEETEKVDVFSLGNVLYFMLTREEPWSDYSSKKVYRLVKEGEQPGYPPEIEESKHPFDVYMIKAIKMCFTYDQYKRPGALEVANKLLEGIQELPSKQP